MQIKFTVNGKVPIATSRDIGYAEKAHLQVYTTKLCNVEIFDVDIIEYLSECSKKHNRYVNCTIEILEKTPIENTESIAKQFFQHLVDYYYEIFYEITKIEFTLTDSAGKEFHRTYFKGDII